jgi:predicted nucleotidyltransferase
MTIEQIKEELTKPEYHFLGTNPYLAGNMMLIGLGGSHAYGTNNENSDLDIRGIAHNTPSYILSGRDFEQVVDVPTDTVIYSLDKIIKLFCEANPNTIEMLGCKTEHYLKLTPIGKIILENKELFLSQRAIYTFGGYANSQLRRMENKSARLADQAHREQNILKSIENAWIDLKRRHMPFVDDAINLYIDDALSDTMDKEIFMDIHLTHYPLRDYSGLHSELHNIVKDYNKNNHRNTNAITHDKLGKHMMHLVRLYYMCFDILEKGEINTYSEKEHDLLVSIRDGAFLDAERQPTTEFYELLNELNARFDYSKANTVLPEHVDMKKVRELKFELNSMVIRGEV